MRVTGIITEYISDQGGFGRIRYAEGQLEARFERSESNYYPIRINDEVRFDVVRSFDGIMDALNIEFVSNGILKELDICYQKQLPILCKVLNKNEKGFLIDFKNVTLFLPDNYCVNSAIEVGQVREFYVQAFSYSGSLIAALQKNRSDDLIKTFITYINSNESLLFELIEIGEYGVLMSRDSFIGFVPNSHLGPFENRKFKIGDSFLVKVIGCSVANGLILSLRNHYYYDSIERIRNAYKNEEVLTGIVMSKLYKYVYPVKYYDIVLKININHLITNNIKEGDEISFKIIDFSQSRDISISNIEIGDYGILNQMNNNNFFTANVVSVLNNGLIVALNKFYINAFLPIEELTQTFDKEAVLERVKLGSIIHCSIMQFDSSGLYVSRLKYKKKKRKEKAVSFFKLNDKVKLKIKDTIASFGLLVQNEYVDGLISIKDMLPQTILENINIRSFIKFNRNIFKRRLIISCIVSNIDRDSNKIYFDFDLSDSEVRQLIEKMIYFFVEDKEAFSIIEKYYNQKKNSIEDMQNI